ncbi:MAG: phosphoenolpyruvate--protein phosphotransferase [Chromatiales bacterium]|jgi:phosphotransferase system enzyme I (PtsP)|nr:phosphoenolpyruvate--protein phosphotransferase [Chromatiales bacterium]
MLSTLKRIVQEVNATSDLGQALSVIVTRVKQAMKVDVCSVYLLDPASDQYVLMATDGLNPASVGVVRLARGEGLVSVVGETEEPLNLDDAPAHPRYHFVAETGESYYHGFLGVPIIHHRSVMGVLVVRQKDQRRFDDDELAFLLTVAAQLSSAIALAIVSGDIRGLAQAHGDSGLKPIQGLAGAPGVTIGTARVIYPATDLDAVPDRQATDIDAEIAAFHAALVAAREDIRLLEVHMGESIAEEDRALFHAYSLMLDSPGLERQTVERIRAGNWAAGALRDTIREHTRVFDAMEDPYLRERAGDVRDIGLRILARLQNIGGQEHVYGANTILVGEEITVSMLAEVPLESLAGVASVRGSTFSHVAILARSLGIPAVLGLSELPVTRVDGSELVVDGYRGWIYVSPSATVRAEYERLIGEEQQLTAGLEELRDLPAVTLDGIHVPLYANAGLVSDVMPSLRHGAEGIGLYRTEFPFMVRNRFPGEEEQLRIYRQVLEALTPRPVTIRTLDIGGDKMLSYFPIHEENPFLGWRGIRVTLDHPELFLIQLRAILRADIGLGNARLLLPMISSVGEVEAALKLIRRVHQELREGGEDAVLPPIGVMVEVPSAVYQIESLASRVDYLSIGSNDLTQYMLAVDRNNARVAELYDALHPAVLQALTYAMAGAQRAGKPIGVCGEMAGDPAAVILLLGMGVSNLSASVASLPRIKRVIRSFSVAQARDILDQVLLMEDARQIRDYVNGVLEQAGLGSLVRVGQ